MFNYAAYWGSQTTMYIFCSHNDHVSHVNRVTYVTYLSGNLWPGAKSEHDSSNDRSRRLTSFVRCVLSPSNSILIGRILSARLCVRHRRGLSTQVRSDYLPKFGQIIYPSSVRLSTRAGSDYLPELGRLSNRAQRMVPRRQLTSWESVPCDGNSSDEGKTRSPRPGMAAASSVSWKTHLSRLLDGKYRSM